MISYAFRKFYGHDVDYRQPLRSKIIRKKRCSPFGCIIRPKELTDSIRSDISEIKESTDSNIALSYGDKDKGGLTQQGKDHTSNQDRGIIVSPFYTDEKVQYFHGSGNDFLIGIFDGHGDLGGLVSQFLQENFHKKIFDKLSTVDVNTFSVDVVKNILNETFIEIDRDLPLMDGNEYNIGENGGSTASVIFRFGSHIFFANAGDSLSFLGQYDRATAEAKIVHKNRFDKPYLPDERERIERMQGKIFTPPHPMNSRVLAFNPIRKETMSLGMSRSIGDNSHGRIGVVAEPIIDVLNLDEMMYSKPGEKKENVDFFVVSSSDGLYDHRRPEFVAAQFANCFFAAADGHPIVESANIIDLATPKDPKRYRDDITVMALKIMH